MARKTAESTATTDVDADVDAQAVGTDEEVPFEGMPTADSDADSDADGKAERSKVPKEMRPIFNEIARLSSILGLARKGVYNNDAARVLKALELLEKQTPAAREMAELVAP